MGRNKRPTTIHLQFHTIWPCHQRVLASLHATYWHPCIDFLVYVQVESGRDRARQDICGPTDPLQQFSNASEPKRVEIQLKIKFLFLELNGSNIWHQFSRVLLN